jgi:hypothetical protein
VASRSLSRRDFDRLFQAAENAAGPRYTREANVEVPIAGSFEALQRTPAFFEHFERLARDLDTSRSYFLDALNRFREVAEITPPFRALGLRCEGLTRRLDQIPRDPISQLPLRPVSRLAARIETDAEGLANDLYEDIQQVPDGDGAQERKRLLENIASGANSIRLAAAEVGAFCDGPQARVANVGALLLVGDAGQGKTHLLCDVVRRALEEGHPAIVLFGQHFRSTEVLWNQIATQIGVSGLTGRAALTALERLGRQKDCRALLMIDALNEGGGIGLWPQALNGFIQAARAHPHVVVAVSCRSSYVGAVVRRRVERSVVRFEHQGFAGVEADATSRFFTHYGIRHPAIPLLSPEFSRPLFLKLFCAGLQGRQAKTAPSGHRGMTDVLENFARTVGRKLVRDIGGPPQLLKLPWECLKELASQMAQLSSESLDRPNAEAVVAAFVQGKLPAKELFQKMVDEGLLAEDLRYDNRTPVPIIRFPYQQFSDHLIARYLLKRYLDRNDPRRCFEAGGGLERLVANRSAVWRHSGLLQALAIQIPEWTAFELLDLIPNRAHEEIYRAHIQSIVWRRPDRFPDVHKVVLYLNEGARSNHSLVSEVWSALLTVAVVPNHPLNAERLHGSLWSRPLRTRDATWSQYIHRGWTPGSVVDRYLAWSDSVDAKSLPDDALLLAAIALTWFFSSSNRFIRDRSTKALVRIMRGRFGVLSSLLDLFRGVNDLYVTERLLCAAYGCALLSADATNLAALARKVHNHYLTGKNRQRHILVRDYAEGIVARARILSPALRFRTVKTRWRGVQVRARTREDLSSRYEHERDYWSIWYSVMAQGDFDRYVIEPAVRQFTGYRLGQPIRRDIRQAGTPSPEIASLFSRQLSGQPLSSTQEAALIRWQSKRQRRGDPKETFDIDVARRWIFTRVLSLGWTPERFLETDRMINYDNMREARKPERIGKKYQWIGYHELLGLLADNYRWHSGFHYENAHRCPGAWAMNIRDIDPSHLPWSRPTSGGPPWWQPLRYSLKPVEGADPDTWIRNRYWPDPKPLILSTDSCGNEWIVSEGHYGWRDAHRSGDEGYREVWYQLRCYLVRSADAARMRRWLSRQDFMGRWMPESASKHGDFVAEYPWHPSAREARQGWTRGWRRSNRLPVSVLIPAASLSWDESFDASMDGSYSGIVPAAWLVPEFGATWQPPFDYVTQSGRVVAQDPSWHLAGPHVGLVRRPEFEQVCRKLRLVPFWTLLGEKRVIQGFGRPSLPWREVTGFFELDGDQVVGSSRQKLRSPRN